ncbi:kinase-like domain-containing protein [Multifurca ochricompacta]|uniref:Kinase-like domain-containing protein n=1 Tax=Multifurca ochricompacta TaxID=376703 RepID=A0AAD4M3N4_9AGAM|nr:kinase-like domain-containing protein [Multifurca ochricompacta]
MGNNQSQSQSPSPIQKIPRKIAGKFPVSSLRDRPKDSGYRSGSASSSGTAAKGVRSNDQASTTVASTGSEQGGAPGPESAPNNVERPHDAPAPPTHSAENSPKPPSEMPNAPATVPCQVILPHREDTRKWTYAIVKEAVHIKTGKYYACKVINKKLMEGREFMVRNEIAVLKRVSSGHQNIVTLYDYFETANNLYLCFDLCTGGELFDRICAKGNYHEPDAADLVRTIMKGVQYIHDSGIVHRDLKPENLIFRTPAEDADIMIADFGLSRVMEEERFHLLTEICGTPGYMAPEIFKKTGHGKPVDIWAMGVITYFLLAGYTPFDRENQQQEMEAIIAGDYKFEPEEYWANVSETAKSFVTTCLTVDPAVRPTAVELLGHRWLADEKPHFVPDPESPTGGPTDLLPHIQKRLDARTRFRRAVWGITAMKRMSTLVALSGGGELQANIAKYKEESEKEDVDEGREVIHHHNQRVDEEAGNNAAGVEASGLTSALGTLSVKVI